MARRPSPSREHEHLLRLPALLTLVLVHRLEATTLLSASAVAVRLKAASLSNPTGGAVLWVTRRPHTPSRSLRVADPE